MLFAAGGMFVFRLRIFLIRGVKRGVEELLMDDQVTVKLSDV
jgi:hypothetical protein